MRERCAMVGFVILDLDQDGHVMLHEFSEMLENWGLLKGEAKRAFKRLKLVDPVTPEQWVKCKPVSSLNSSVRTCARNKPPQGCFLPLG